MPDWTDPAEVRKVLDSLWSTDDKKLRDPHFNMELKEKTMTVMDREFGYNPYRIADDQTAVVIEDDPFKEVQMNDGKLQNLWQVGQKKYVLILPHPRTEYEFQDWSNYLAELHKHYDGTRTLEQGL